MSIATRKGDNGTTGLLYGQRVSKTDTRIEAVGSLDALNVAIGNVRVFLADTNVFVKGYDQILLEKIQNTLIALMGEVSCHPDDTERYNTSKFSKLTELDLTALDERVAEIEARSPKFDGWATPGVNSLEIALEQARVAARTAERRVLNITPSVRPLVVQYLNRLSDMLWLMARVASK